LTANQRTVVGHDGVAVGGDLLTARKIVTGTLDPVFGRRAPASGHAACGMPALLLEAAQG
jgi:hypothetical protein